MYIFRVCRRSYLLLSPVIACLSLFSPGSPRHTERYRVLLPVHEDAVERFIHICITCDERCSVSLLGVRLEGDKTKVEH